MAGKQVTVVALIKAKAGLEEKVCEVLQGLIGPTRSEAGCINYDMHRDVADRALFMFHENWVSKAALDEHLAKPHLQAFLAQADDLLAQPVEITLWDRID